MKIRQYVRSFWQSSAALRFQEYLFEIREKITGYPRLKWDFQIKTGYELDLDNPASFNQKVSWKKVYDRNPLLPVVADKYQVRDYLRRVLGTEEAEEILIPLLYVTNKPETIPFDDLPEEYIIKANHGSRTNIIVEKERPITRQHIIAQCRIWLKTPYAPFKHEWAYQKIKRKIVIEKLLRDENGKIPVDYKFHMANGKCLMIQVNQGNFSDPKNRTLTLFTKDWSKIDVFWHHPPADSVERPENLDTMIQLAETLSRPFDYVRIDLYSIKNKIYFGEFTNYPTSGRAIVKPLSFDFEIGAKWQLTPKYWKRREQPNQ